MTILGAAKSAASEQRAGDRVLSVVSATVDDGDTVTMDGEIVADMVMAQADDGTNVANVTGVNGADATVASKAISDATAANGVDVTVFAVVER